MNPLKVAYIRPSEKKAAAKKRAGKSLPLDEDPDYIEALKNQFIKNQERLAMKRMEKLQNKKPKT